MKKEENKKITLTVFEGSEVRKVGKNNKGYFSIIDIVAILSESKNPRRYGSDLKIKIKE